MVEIAEYETFLRDLKKFQKIICEREEKNCNHNRCKACFSCVACINGCYGDECAFEGVIDAIEELIAQEDDKK